MNTFLRDRRVRCRISQASLAKELGVSQQTIARWETGGQVPAKYLRDLAMTLGARVQDFLPETTPSTDPTSDPSGRVPVTGGVEETPFGDIAVSYVGEPHSRSYPITRGVINRIHGKLGHIGPDAEKAHSWVQFETLDNKWVAINTAHVECLAFVDDNVEAMTEYFHDEVYKAARELYVDMPASERARDRDFPYSERMLAEVARLLEPMGQSAVYELDGVTCAFASGRVVRSHMSVDIAMTLASALIDVEPSDLPPDNFLSLFDPDSGKYQYIRLGSLRYIEASLLAFNEAEESE